MFRQWLITLIREAVRAEITEHFRAQEEMIGLCLSNIAVRAKEKQEDAKKAPHSLGKQWSARARDLEAKSESIG